MTRLGHGLLTSILVWTFTAALLRSTAFAEPNDACRILILNVLNNAGIPNGVLTPARDHVERIYRNIGIQIVWRMDDADDGTLTTDGSGFVSSDSSVLQLTIALTPEAVAEQLDPGSTRTGFAVGNSARGARRAYVFSGRVNAQADQVRHQMHFLNLKAARGLVLGHVIAHEAGHLMLPHGGHNRKGIMKARTDLRSWEKAFRESLLFTPEEAKLIRAALSGQTEQ